MIALAGFAFRGHTPPDFVDFAAGLGATGIDYWPWNRGELAPAQFRQLAESTGLRVVCVNVPSAVTRVAGGAAHPQDDAAIITAMDEAAALGAPAVQVYAAVPDGADPAAALAASVRPLLPHARTRGLTLLVENNLDQRGEDPHGRNPSRRPEFLRRALETVDDPAFRLCFDPANFLAVGEEPFPAAYRQLRPYFGAVHVKDCRRYDPRRDAGAPEAAKLLVDSLAGPFLPTTVGDGAVPWPRIAAELAADGYDGWVTLDPFVADELLASWCRDSAAAWRRIASAVPA